MSSAKKPMTITQKPRVLSLHLSSMNWLDVVFPDFMQRIHRQTDYYRVYEPIDAINALNESWAAVFVTDEGPTLSVNELVRQAVLQYASNGGVVICMGMFASGQPSRVKRFFKDTGLDWEIGPQYRTTVYQNKENIFKKGQSILPSALHTTSFFIKNTKPEHAWYCLPTAGHKPLASCAVLAPYGRGKIGVVGNSQEEAWSSAVVLGMMGLWHGVRSV